MADNNEDTAWHSVEAKDDGDGLRWTQRGNNNNNIPEAILQLRDGTAACALHTHSAVNYPLPFFTI